MTITVERLSSEMLSSWDSYVEQSGSATFFHLAGWKEVLERAFGYKTHFLFARKNGVIVGVLPLAQVNSVLFGSSLASLPFCVYGGIVSDHEDAVQALRREACNLADALHVDALEFRNKLASNADWPVKSLYFTFRKNIDPDNDINLKAIPNRQRAMVRKGIKEGLTSEWSDSTERFYRVYSESVKNLGTPVFSQKYLRILQQVFGSKCSILMLKHEGRDVAGVLSFYFKNEVIPYYGGSIGAARKIKGVNHLMYWDLMRYSCEQGYRVFDFGRSKAGTGPFSFKKNFGFKPEALPYEYYLSKADAVPDVSPLNPKYRLLINAWRKLPLPVANLIGPLLARSLG